MFMDFLHERFMVEPRANMLSLLECFMVEYPHNAQISCMNGLWLSIEEVYSLYLNVYEFLA